MNLCRKIKTINEKEQLNTEILTNNLFSWDDSKTETLYLSLHLFRFYIIKNFIFGQNTLPHIFHIFIFLILIGVKWKEG